MSSISENSEIIRHYVHKNLIIFVILYIDMQKTLDVTHIHKHNSEIVK